jgi:uncharacterized damage-inducible protein DinB
MVPFVRHTALFVMLALATSVAVAQTAAESPFRAEFEFQVDDVAKKIVALAQAMPEEKYGWRPSEGVRSVSQVYLHIALGNFFVPRFAGVDPPKDATRDLEGISEKGRVIETLQKSIQHLKEGWASLSEADLEKRVKIFGTRDTSARDVFMTVLMHMHEHLGQSIAYARSNGITPPWSER